MNRIHAMLFCGACLLSACAGIGLQQPPACQLTVSPAFAYSEAKRQFKKGDLIVNSPPYVKKADCPMTRVIGHWGPHTSRQEIDHGWGMEVSSGPTAKVLDARNLAKDGYDANVDEEGNYMFARFERKTFAWGKAFSYFTQYTQDTGVYVPHNGHLTYEVWGVTNDLRHVVHAHFAMTLRGLANWGPDVRDAQTMEALKNDRDYKRIESCSADAFEPALADIDKLVGSLRMQ